MTYTATPTQFEIYADDDPRELAAKIEMQDEVASTIKIRTCVNPDNWPGLSDAILAALLQMHPQGGGEAVTPDQRIHGNLERICNAAGVSIAHCTEDQLVAMREEMRKIMSESYIKGSNDHYAAMVAARMRGK